MQPVHKPVTEFGAESLHTLMRNLRWMRVSPNSSTEMNVGDAEIDCSSTVKIAHFARPARDLDFDRCGDGRLRPSVERSETILKRDCRLRCQASLGGQPRAAVPT